LQKKLNIKLNIKADENPENFKYVHVLPIIKSNVNNDIVMNNQKINFNKKGHFIFKELLKNIFFLKIELDEDLLNRNIAK